MTINLLRTQPPSSTKPSTSSAITLVDKDITQWSFEKVRALHKVIGLRDAPLRKTSNLLNYVQRDLKPAETREGFFGFYFGRHRADLRLNPSLMYIAIAMSFMRPNVRMHEVKSSSWQRSIRGLLMEYRKELREHIDLANQLGVKKDNVNKEFIIRAPIMASNADILRSLSIRFFNPDPDPTGEKVVQALDILEADPAEGFEGPEGVEYHNGDNINTFRLGKVIPASQLKANGFLTPSLIKGLTEADARFVLRRGSTYFYGFLELKMSQAQAEYLTTMPWIEIRPSDIYGPCREWVGGIAISRRPPTFTVPIAKIRSSTVNAGGEPRTNDDKVLVDEDGEFWAIPDVVDNIEKYDSDLSSHLSNPSGFFGSNDDDLQVKGNRPASMPVFVDWLNLKFVYSSADSGRIVVKALDRCVPATMTHYNRLFNKPIEQSDYLKSMLSFAMVIGKRYGTYSGNRPLISLLGDYREFLNRNEEETGIRDVHDFTLKVLYEHTSVGKTEAEMTGLFPVKDVDDLLTSFGPTLKAIDDNLQVANAEYSVETICKLQAFLTIVSKHGPKYKEVYHADRKNREAYLDQRKDPNFQLEDLPYIAKDRSLLPHQVDIMNSSRKSPDFMVVAAQAGGGKTMIAITDFLKELKHNPKLRGLIMCPSHLVKDYVTEIVYATNGLLNAIPVTTYSVKRMGLKLLGEMIEKSPVNTLVITDYNVIRLMATRAGYGNSTQQVFPIIEFLRQFRFDWVTADECFVAGTQVDTPKGPRPIEQIKEGDLVLGANGPSKVLATSVKNTDTLVRVSYAGGEVVCTKNHPFFTQRGWVQAGSLDTQDQLVTTEHATAILANVVDTEYSVQLNRILLSEVDNSFKSIEVDRYRRNTTPFIAVDNVAPYTSESTSVYNLHVEGHPSYSVNGALVHNCHFLKGTSSRQSAVHRLFSEIPKKRLASGTFVADTPDDVVRQIGLMDPTLFGSNEQFAKEYSTGMESGKLVWDEARIKEAIKKNVVWAEAHRKQWAALLPFPQHEFNPAYMTPKQREVYGKITAEIKVSLADLAIKSPALRKLLKALSMDMDSVVTDSNEVEDDKIDQTNSLENSEDDDALQEMDLDKILNPYLQRIEQFLSAPMSDPIGKIELTEPEDQRSPKVNKLISILDEHFAAVEAGTIKGKVLIFTQYTASASNIYESLPPKYKEMCIHYTADRKVECGAQFKNDPRKQIMVGVETSMNTGLNLQFCVRLIRCETVWTPGNFEQGNSRINRPNVKAGEFRQHVYYNWILCDNSIDVTKASYLISKIISKARFDEDDPRYSEIPKPKPFKMNLETILGQNTIEDLKNDYLGVYQQYLQIQQDEYSEYRERYTKEMERKMGVKEYAEYRAKNGDLVKTDVNRAPDLKDSKLMARVPYVPGTELYGAKHLGLVRYDDFMLENSAEISDEDEDEANETVEQREKNSADMQKLAGLYAHTDLGDGEIVRVNKTTITVKLPSGHRVSTHKLSSFIITKPLTSGRDMRTMLARQVGDLPVDTPPEIPGATLTTNKERKLSTEQQRQIELIKQSKDGRVPIVLRLGTLNDYLMIEVVNVDDAATVRAAQAQGFVFAPAHFVTQITHSFRFNWMLNRWGRSGTDKDTAKPKGKKLTMDPRCMEAMYRVSKHVGDRGKIGGSMFNVAKPTEIRVFLRMQSKPNPDPTFISPYPMFEDGTLYIALPAVGHPGSKTAIQVLKNNGISIPWKRIEANERLHLIAPSKDAAWKKIQKMEEEGFLITNKDELLKQFKTFKQVREATRPITE